MSSTTTTHEQQPCSNDTFAPNYRHICPWDERERAEFIATWPLPLRADYFQVYESAEHAEHTRPWDQLYVLLRQRGLEDEFIKMITGGRDYGVEEGGEKTQTQTQSLNDDDEWYEKVRELLMEDRES
jgi:hypothetical protein